MKFWNLELQQEAEDVENVSSLVGLSHVLRPESNKSCGYAEARQNLDK